MEKFIGGSPAAVAIRLAIISIIVGLILSAVGVDPYDIWSSIKEVFVHIYNLGFDAVELVLRYFIIGAVLVVPIWLIVRAWKTLGR